MLFLRGLGCLKFHFVPTRSPYSYIQLFLSFIFLILFLNITFLHTNTHIPPSHFIWIQDKKLSLVKLAIFVPLKTNLSHSGVSCRFHIDISNAPLRLSERKGNEGKVWLRCLRNNLKLLNLINW